MLNTVKPEGQSTKLKVKSLLHIITVIEVSEIKKNSGLIPPKRLGKSQSTCKMKIACTSQIKATELELNGKIHIDVVWYKSHYNYAEEVQHLHIPKQQRSQIAAKLISGISVTKILEQTRDNITGDKLRRIDILNEGRKNSIDAISVDLWVEEENNSQNSAVVYYKKQGAKNDILQDEDFCLVVMNTSQQHMLKKFGENIIAIDSTHGLNQYDFDLSTIMVIDEFDAGFPAAFMFTNRKDSIIFEIFFSKIKDKIGHAIIAKTFMSDITNTFYNSWKAVIGTPHFQLYCACHIDRVWKVNLNKIPDVEKRKVYKILKYLHNCSNQDTFEEELDKSLRLFLEDSETMGDIFNAIILITINFGQLGIEQIVTLIQTCIYNPLTKPSSTAI